MLQFTVGMNQCVCEQEEELSDEGKEMEKENEK
jgi:hypothetical protein